MLARAGQPLSVATLTDALCGGERADGRAGQRLHIHVHRLRRLLGQPERLSFSPGEGYRLRVETGELDAARFEALADEAVHGLDRDPPSSAAVLREALGLWRGTPFSGVDVPVLRDWAHRLAERRLVATEWLYQAELNAGQDGSLVPELTALVREHPLRERLYALLMTALYRSGGRAEALTVYQDARRTLVEELGLEPGSPVGLPRRARC